jgi:hypothetical protein
MAVTPSDILDLALARHRRPWNFTAHFVALAFFALALLLHSFLLFAASLIFFGAGFFELSLSAMPEGRWLRFVRGMIEWERNWSVLPWTAGKWARTGFVALLVCVLVWALWTVDLVVLALFCGFGYLARVVAENRAGGIDP